MAAGWVDAFRMAWGWLSRGAAPPANPTRLVTLPGAVRTSFTLPGSIRTSFTLPASTAMSISGNWLSFFAGEAITITIPVAGFPALTGQTITWKLFDSTNTLRLTKTPAPDTPAVGSLRVSLADADTTSLTPGAYRYECWIGTPGSEAMVHDGPCAIQARYS